MKRNIAKNNTATKEIVFNEGSGNVFEDLGFPNSKKELLKAELVYQINQEIKKRKLNQQEAAKVLKCEQPEISKLQNCNYYRFGTDRLLNFLNCLGLNTNIVISKAKNKTDPEQKVTRRDLPLINNGYGFHC